MKLEPILPATQQYFVERYSDTEVVVGGQAFTESVLLLAGQPPQRWEITRWQELNEAVVEALLTYQPDLVVFGSGQRQAFLPPHLTAKFWAKHIGCDVMTNGAACRTYNFLLQEERKALLALLIHS